MRENVPVTVDVVNNTDAAEYVHWHGMLIPAEVDGAEEEGTPAVPPQGRRRYQLTPKPAGTRWYHTHAMSNGDLHRGSYTGQFGFVMVEAANNPGQFDQEVFLALRDWEPFYTQRWRPTPTSNPRAVPSPNGLRFSIPVRTALRSPP